MNYMANLSDVMLVLAVGIMLALVSAWQLDLSKVGEKVQISQDTETLNASSNEDGKKIEDYGLREYGMVYVDENGNFYMIEDGEITENK